MTEFSRRSFGLGAGLVTLAGLAGSGRALAAGFAAGGPDPLSAIDPELRPAAEQILRMSAGMGPLDMAALPGLRAIGEKFAAPRLADIPVEARQVPVGGGNPDVTVYVINARAGGSRPGILHTHGGGYIAGQAKWEVGYLQAIARELDCVIVTVEYRLAPETPYTGSIEDNYAGLRWMDRNAGMLGLDRGRIALLGESAGGGHAARLAITARDRGEVKVALQALIYPMLDDRTGSSRAMPFPIGVVGWNGPSNRFGWRSFLGREPGGSDVPAAGVPARVADLAGLPPAFIAVGSVDLFVSEDLEYARRLVEAAVPTEVHVTPGAFHGFDRVAATTTPAQIFTKAKMNALRRAFGQPVVV